APTSQRPRAAPTAVPAPTSPTRQRRALCWLRGQQPRACCRRSSYVDGEPTDDALWIFKWMHATAAAAEAGMGKMLDKHLAALVCELSHTVGTPLRVIPPMLARMQHCRWRQPCGHTVFARPLIQHGACPIDGNVSEHAFA
ncbi:unnamed protein product, partial [Closterium sp. NIES-64]